MPDYRRISIQVDEALYQRINRAFEWGERNRVLVNLLNWICEKIEKHGKAALIILLREDAFDDLLMMRGIKNGDNK